jgi:hypothetical protein
MGSSKSSTTSNVNMGPYKPTQPYIDAHLQTLPDTYGAMKNNPLIGQAQQYTSDVLGGNYLDPALNPYLQKYAQGAAGNVASQFNTMMGRAGRGNLTGGDAQQSLAAGMMSAIAPIYAQQYNIERGYQDTASRAAPSMVASMGAPDDWLSNLLQGYGRLGQQGSTKSETTTTPSTGQTIAGIGLTALGMMTGNPMMAMQGMSGLGGPQAASMMNPFGAGGMMSNVYGPPAPLPWQQAAGGGYK